MIGLAAAALIAIVLAGTAAVVFESVLVFLIALPVMLFACSLVPIFLFFYRRLRAEVDSELKMADELEQAGHLGHAARALGRAIAVCEKLPAWDGTEKSECCRLHARLHFLQQRAGGGN